MKTIRDMFEEIKDTIVEDTNAPVKEVLPFMSGKVEEELIYAENCHKLEEQMGCSFETIVKAFKKYIGWTTDCDFGYDNIPDEYEKYKNDKKFENSTYNDGLIYIAIQETLKEDKSE